MDRKKISEYLYELAYGPDFGEGYFDIPLADGIYAIGASCKNEDMKRLYGFKAYYENIVDLSKKIRISLSSAQGNDCLFSDDGYCPFDKPGRQELFGTYFAENIAFRVSVLWDILGQLYNLKFQCGYNEENLHYKRIFHNCAQKGENFARKVEQYLSEDDETGPEGDTEQWRGNHKYLSNFRNALTHRNSPNITAITSTINNIRPPVAYSLKRILEDYYVVCGFLQELLVSVHDEFFGAEVDKNA